MASSSSTTSVDWDTSLMDGQSAWSTPVASTPSDINSVIEKASEVKVDANDYSRFKDIGADEEEDDKDKTAKAAPVAPVPETCRNCHTPGAKLKCSVCKKASYCARACQASDWAFHKRICKKPEPEKKPEPPRKRPATSDSTNSSSSSVSASKATTTTTTKSASASTSTSKKASASTGSKEVVTDDPDLPAAADMRGYKNGLPYFHRELSENEQKLIGDIAPKKVEVAPEVAKPVVHEGSAWNAAGTFEERTFTKWAEAKWTELLCSTTFAEGEFNATLLAPEKITGDASICVVRGKKRYLFDFSFKLPFEVTVNGIKYKGSYQLNEISNDEDYEITARLSKKPADAAQASALQKFVGSRTSGLQKELLRLIGEFYRQFQEQ